MTFEEMERGLKVLQDNMTVQGAMMHRLENNLDRLETLVVENGEAIARIVEVINHLADGQASLLSAMHSLVEHVDKVAGRVDSLADGQASLQSAMHSLFDRMDRFIRGLESDGHKRRRKRGEA